jgi:hypothetical protein
MKDSPVNRTKQCCRCKEWFDKKEMIDTTYRIGDTETIVTEWTCKPCMEEWYQEALSHIP